MAWRVSERLGVEGLGELARYIQASREAARAGGERGRGRPPWRCTRRGAMWPGRRRGSPRPGPSAQESPEPKAAPVERWAEWPRWWTRRRASPAEVVEAKLLRGGAGGLGPAPARGRGAAEEAARPALDAPPPGVPEGYALLGASTSPTASSASAELEQGKAVKGPLRWEGYERMRGRFARGLAFERAMVELLRADAAPAAGAAPVAQGLQPAAHRDARGRGEAGRARPALRGRARHRGAAARGPAASRGDLQLQEPRPLPAGGRSLDDADARRTRASALDYYGGTLDIRRPSLKQPGRGAARSALSTRAANSCPRSAGRLRGSRERSCKEDVPGVEVLVQ